MTLDYTSILLTILMQSQTCVVCHFCGRLRADLLWSVSIILPTSLIMFLTAISCDVTIIEAQFKLNPETFRPSHKQGGSALQHLFDFVLKISSSSGDRFSQFSNKMKTLIYILPIHPHPTGNQSKQQNTGTNNRLILSSINHTQKK